MQVKLEKYQTQKLELENKQKLKLLSEKNINSKQLEIALDLYRSQNNKDKEINIENN